MQSKPKSSELQNVYIGIDVHLRQWHVAITQGGITRKPFMQSPSVEVLLNHLRKNYPDCKYYSAYEAGYCGFSIHRSLVEAGISNIVVNAADIPHSDKERARKTDSADSAKISRELSKGTLRSVFIPSIEQHNDRAYLRCRQMIVNDIRRIKARIRHALHTNGIAIPEEFPHGTWSKVFVSWLEKLCAQELGGGVAAYLSSMLKTLSHQQTNLKNIETRIKTLMQSEKYQKNYMFLRTIPGMGEVTIHTILLEGGDLSAFSSADKFCSFIGLVPDMHQSDNHNPNCSITQRRHKTMRYMFVECAWRAIHIDESLSRCYAHYCRTMPKTKAIIRIANKLAKITKFVLKNQTQYVQKDRSTYKNLL